MNKILYYILYGFYQIDYVFGDHRYPYMMHTGAVLFFLSFSLYTCSATLMIVGWGIQCGFINLYSENLLEILLFGNGIILVIWWGYLEKKKSIN
jgi:hypothetical protein